VKVPLWWSTCPWEKAEMNWRARMNLVRYLGLAVAVLALWPGAGRGQFLVFGVSTRATIASRSRSSQTALAC